ncbi:unnamed protein product [Ectocarpus sp. 12 AP-2014]
MPNICAWWKRRNERTPRKHWGLPPRAPPAPETSTTDNTHTRPTPCLPRYAKKRVELSRSPSPSLSASCVGSFLGYTTYPDATAASSAAAAARAASELSCSDSTTAAAAATIACASAAATEPSAATSSSLSDEPSKLGRSVAALTFAAADATATAATTAAASAAFSVFVAAATEPFPASRASSVSPVSASTAPPASFKMGFSV